MLEQIIVPNQYELAKLLPHFIRPEDFKAKGMSYFLIEPSAENTYKIDLQEKIYYDEMIFMEEVSLHLAGSAINMQYRHTGSSTVNSRELISKTMSEPKFT